MARVLLAPSWFALVWLLCCAGVTNPLRAEAPTLPRAGGWAAEPPGPAERTTWKLQDLEALALQTHPGLFEAQARIDAARGRAWQAGLMPNPRIGYVANEIGGDGSAGQHGAFVGQQIIRGGKRQLDRAVACREVTRLREAYDVMRQRVLTDVRLRYLDVYWLQQRATLLARFQETNQSAARMAKHLFDAGDTASSDVLLAEIELAQTVTDTLRLDAQRTAAWRALGTVVGDVELAVAQLHSPGVTVKALTWQDVQTAVDRTPEMTAAAAVISRAHMALRRAQVEPVPDLNTQLSVQYDYGTNDTFAGVQLGFPIPTRNRNQGGIAAARAEIRAAEQRLARVQLRLVQDLALRFSEFQNAQLQARQMRENIVPKAEDVVRIAFEAYRAGEISMSDVLNAQRSLLRATLRQQEAEKQLQSSFVEIEGFLLTGSLAAES